MRHPTSNNGTAFVTALHSTIFRDQAVFPVAANRQTEVDTNVVAVYPVGVAQHGDSGAALFRHMSQNDRAVAGTFSGFYRTVYGRELAIYTSAVRYGF